MDNGKPLNNGWQHPTTNYDPLPSSLTEVEIFSRNSSQILYPLADGHAGQYDEPWWKSTVNKLPAFDLQAAKLSDREAEKSFFKSFNRLFNQFGAQEFQNYKVLPNASMSIEVMMGVAKRRNMSVMLLEPCFDNLYRYGLEKGISIQSLPEDDLFQKGIDAVDTQRVDFLMIVSPNNPTGCTLDSQLLKQLAEQCARDRVTLVIDASFRAYDTTGADHYSIVKEAGCSWAIIEDTGKTWCTRERKASILSCSNDLKKDVNEIVEIHVLGWSTPILCMLTHLADTFENIGLDKALRQRVSHSRALIRKAIGGTILRPATVALNSTLPVEWIEVLDDRFDDLAIVKHLTNYGIGVLPGRHFYFSNAARSSKPAKQFIRVSLLKEQNMLESAAAELRRALLEIR